MGMVREERQRRILNLLEEKTAVSVRELTEVLGVNAMMLWRDLRDLGEQGLLRRVRGGAQRADVAKEATFRAKRRARSMVKGRLARVAVEKFVKEGDVVVLEGGTTVTEVAELVAGMRVTVLTNSLPVAQRLFAAGCKCTVYLSGGLLRGESGTFVGREAVRFFSGKRADVFFMSSTGLEEGRGFTDPNPQEIEVKQAMIRAAKRVVALVDSSKVGVSSLMPVTVPARVGCLVTDAEREKVAWLERRGVQLVMG